MPRARPWGRSRSPRPGRRAVRSPGALPAGLGICAGQGSGLSGYETGAAPGGQQSTSSVGARNALHPQTHTDGKRGRQAAGHSPSTRKPRLGHLPGTRGLRLQPVLGFAVGPLPFQLPDPKAPRPFPPGRDRVVSGSQPTARTFEIHEEGEVDVCASLHARARAQRLLGQALLPAWLSKDRDVLGLPSLHDNSDRAGGPRAASESSRRQGQNDGTLKPATSHASPRLILTAAP